LKLAFANAELPVKTLEEASRLVKDARSPALLVDGGEVFATVSPVGLIRDVEGKLLPGQTYLRLVRAGAVR
jgi:hypothetical protein